MGQQSNSLREEPANGHVVSRGNYCRNSPLSQIIAIQRMLMADILNPETPARERAQCARAWTECEERKRILRMKPKPRDIDTEKLAERKLRLAKPAAIFLDAIESKPKRALGDKRTDEAVDKPIDVVTDTQADEPPANVAPPTQSGS